MALVSNKNKSNFKPFPLTNGEDFKVLAASTKLKEVGRVVIVGAYIPPIYTAARATDCIEYVSDMSLMLLAA